MIPTSVSSLPTSPMTAASPGANSNSSPQTGAVGGGGGGGGGGNVNGLQSYPEILTGIASLILEGRAVVDAAPSSGSTAGTPPPPSPLLLSHRPDAISSGISGIGIGGNSGGRQSPRPSTSRAAFLSASASASSSSPPTVSSCGPVINIITNPSAYHFNADGGGGGSSASSSLASSAESTHQRWTQKLCQLRQASPMSLDQRLTLEAHGGTSGGDTELLVLASPRTVSCTGPGPGSGTTSVEGVARSPSSAASSLGSGGYGSGSENFLHSLQSLATTCLRGSGAGSPSLEGGGSGGEYHPTLGNTSAAVHHRASVQYRSYRAPVISNPNHQYHHTMGSSTGFGYGSPLDGHTTASGIRGSFELFYSTMRQSPLAANIVSPSPSSIQSNIIPGIGMNRISLLRSPREYAMALTTSMPTATAAAAAAATAISASCASASGSGTPKGLGNGGQPLQQGPHCDRFLRKMGLAKGEAADAEEHFCDMSYMNITCSRWQTYCQRMETIIAQGEAVCIEVYLGPMTHKVLLEQWIITQREKVPPPTMTLPSLCSAIRSQLYFSQVSAWCDLVRRSEPVLLLESGRVIFPKTTGAAGDLATSTGSNNTQQGSSNSGSNSNTTNSSNNGSSNNSIFANGSGCGGGSGVGCNGTQNAPRLNIFYRIKAHDSTACFNSKPNTHNFPNVNLSENCSISVCLKSLPRIGGGIPRVIITNTNTNSNSNNITATVTPTKKTTTATVSRSSAIVERRTATVTRPVNNKMEGIRRTSNGCSSSSNGGSNGRSIASHTIIETPRTSRPSTAVNNNNTSNNNNNQNNNIIGRNITGNVPQQQDTMICDSQHQQYQEQQQQQQHHQLHMIFSERTKATPSSSAALTHTATLPERRDSGIGSSGGGGGGGPSVSNSSNNGSSKYRCKFFIDEEELLDSKQKEEGNGINNIIAYPDPDADEDDEGLDVTDRVAGISGKDCCEDCCADDDDYYYDENAGDCSKGEESLSCNASNISIHMSHREKQLLKYRKRMQRRDKKHRKPSLENILTTIRRNDVGGGSDACPATNWTASPATPIVVQPSTAPEPMEQGSASLTPPHTRRMISTGTQTPLVSVGSISCCPHCGGEKKLVYLNCSRCNIATTAAAVATTTDSSAAEQDEMDDDRRDVQHDSSSTCSSTNDIIRTPRNKAELLLQAIQRTPKTVKKHRKQLLNEERALANQQAAAMMQNNNHMMVGGGTDNIMRMKSSCQVCKRQKTGHNFGIPDPSPATVNEMPHTANTDDHNDDDNDDTQAVHEVVTDKSSNSSIVEGNGAKIATATAANGDDNDANGDGDNNDDVNEDDNQPQHDNETASKCSKIKIESTPPRPQSISCLKTEEIYASSTKLTPHFNRCSLRTTTTANLSSTSLNGSPFKTPSSYPIAIERNRTGNQTSPPTPSPSPPMSSTSTSIRTRIITPLSTNTANTEHEHCHNALLLRKGLPKVNLTAFFCGVQPINNSNSSSSSSAPIPIHCPPSITSTSSIGYDIENGINGCGGGGTFCFDPTTTAMAHTVTTPTATNSLQQQHPVQKSYSAPTLPNTPSPSSLSPRFFAKQSAVHKRRSRHLSDRSDRSSLGSDEPFSDEELLEYNNSVTGGLGNGNGGSLYSPAVSPMKGYGSGNGGGMRGNMMQRFGRLPLLGNLEEALLQRRIMPKTEVLGFKVLLGASGGFCPMQLTIPAIAHFYELHGDTLSTPYVCEIRLPRKGYSVPRSGTVQATLLNPMGTVVRVFVIPYDLSDMPPLHQTFIRQRVLAETGHGDGTAAVTVAQTPNGIPPPHQFGSQQRNNSNSNNNNNINNNNTNNNNNTEQRFVEIVGDESGDCAMGNLHCGSGDDGRIHTNNSHNRNNNNIKSIGGEMGDGQPSEPSGTHFISAEHMKRLRYSIHLRFQTSRSGRLSLHTNIRLLISRRTDCDTAAAHAKGALEAPNDLVTDTIMPTGPKYSARQEGASRI